MYYQFEVGMNGLLESGVTSEKKRVHFDSPVTSSYGKKVPIKGKTYPYKEDIKATEWENTHYDWTGEYWQVDLDTVRDVIRMVARAADEVSCDPEVVYESDSMEPWRGEIELEEEGGETFEFIMGPTEGDERVSRSWAEDAAEVGNYDSVEDFADEFNFDVVDDEVLFGDLDNPSEVGEVNGEPEADQADEKYDLVG